MKLWREQVRAYVRESTAYFQRFAQVANGTPYLSNSDLILPPEECGESSELKPYLRSLLVSSALSAAHAGDCASFRYLKNDVPHCQRADPPAP